MRWPPWSSAVQEDNSKPKKNSSSWTSSVLPSNWARFTSPDVLIPTAVITSTILVSARLYRLYLRRIPGAAKISTSFWRKRSIFGQVTSVGDGDGLRLFHTPGGRLAGWGWFPGRSIPKGKALKDKTVRRSIEEAWLELGKSLIGSLRIYRSPSVSPASTLLRAHILAGLRSQERRKRSTGSQPM